MIFHSYRSLCFRLQTTLKNSTFILYDGKSIKIKSGINFAERVPNNYFNINKIDFKCFKIKK
jgi:hypothetical protein